MFLATDVDYKENTANAAGVLFKNWDDKESFKEYTVQLDKVKEYIPGQFFKRELPCLTALIRTIDKPISVIIVDGFVWLNDIYKKGLGAYLYQKMDKKIPVIGVAKKSFYSLGENYREIYRGESKSPLFITSAGIDLDMAADNIKKMAGEHRIPTMLKRVDRLCRQW